MDKPFIPSEVPWFNCLGIMLRDFVPAESEADADTRWNTNEIANAIAQHFGVGLEKIDRNEVYRAMLYLEYQYSRSGTIGLEWLLKKVN